MGERFDQIGLGVAIGALKKEFSDLGFSVVGDRLADALERTGRRTAKLENDRDTALAERDKWKQNYTRLLNAKLDGSWRLKFDEEITRLENERDAAFALGVERAAQHMSEQTRDEPVEVYVDSILSLAPMTPLQAALALPEVRELVEAARQLRHAACGETGFVNAVRLDTGRAYPWPALDLADDALCAALAKLEAKG